MTKAKPLVVFAEPGAVMREQALLSKNLSDGEPVDVLCHADDLAKVNGWGGAVYTYSGGNLAPCRKDLDVLRERLALPARSATLLPVTAGDAPPHVVTTLGLLGAGTVVALSPGGSRRLRAPCPAHASPSNGATLVLKACGGIGNMVLLTPLLHAALQQGWRTVFCPLSDLDGGSLALLFQDAAPGLEVLEPERVDEVTADWTLNVEAHGLQREGDFHHNPYKVGVPGHEPTFSARFFRNVTGVACDLTKTFVGGDPATTPPHLRDRIVVCPGSKAGWDAKRWPHMNALLRVLDAPLVLCKPQDLALYRKTPHLTPLDAPNATYLTDLNLLEAASLLRTARAVVANDCGMAHVAAAAGAPTLILFGPSSLEKNRHPRSNVRNVHLGLECQPCQGQRHGPGRLGPGDWWCEKKFQCLEGLCVEQVLYHLNRLLKQSSTRNTRCAQPGS